MTTPYWLQDAIFYQIFPDRFSNGDPSNDPANVEKWGSAPNFWGFQGGDLRGIIQRFDYLLELGINAIYLNPIFLSPANHRYHTSDYYKIDPRLGTMLDFHALIDLSHRNNIRIILDGVFNHCSRGFYAFNDLLENNEKSQYQDWFNVHRFPLDAYGPGEAINYDAWWNFKAIPKFNTRNPEVRNYIMGVARYWIERGIDGWRLDVPNEINDDSFWAEFRNVVKSANRDACLIGEIWSADPRWANDTHFDGLMHYPIRDALLSCLTGKTLISNFAESVEGIFNVYPRENIYSMYVTIGTHDTERALTALDGNLRKLKLAFQFIFAYPGAPAIYYGDEIGIEGGKDPDSRRAFPWNPADWKADLHPWVQNLISIRKDRVSLRRGNYTQIAVDNKTGLYAFSRSLGSEKTLIAMNASDTRIDVEIPADGLWPEGKTLRNLLDNQPYIVFNDSIHVSLPAWSGIYIG
ncbi:MAG: glycoside hydrolase family 13 protein [Chloroflexi bacterium]|nr:glycoside hydrolase family 13 protein [Chloroflexota bacterium]